MEFHFSSTVVRKTPLLSPLSEPDESLLAQPKGQYQMILEQSGPLKFIFICIFTMVNIWPENRDISVLSTAEQKGTE